jgi:hypothetical protein
VKWEKIKDIPGCLFVSLVMLFPYLLVVAFWVFIVVGAWKGWTK